MTTDEVVAHYGSIKKVCSVLDIYPQSFYAWGEHPPILRQYQIQVLTDNKLKAEAPSDGITANS